MYQHIIKRIFDILLSLICIIVSSPFLLLIAILVRFKLGTPIIFKQERPGLHNKIFTLYKFRTMSDERGENGKLLPDSIRLTRFGQMLRSTSLDELPEFFNILFGHMSFVGPRPLLNQYIDVYNHRQMRRHEVRPGLTGLAQINGRNAISWEEKFEFDIQYVEKVSFLLDIRIIANTFLKVVSRAEINAYESVTADAFRGTNRRRFSKYKHDKQLRILFISPDNRLELMETFLYAAGVMGTDVYLVGASRNEKDPALLKCHQRYEVPKVGENGYITKLLSICKKEKIEVLIPFNDQEIFLLSQRMDDFAAVGTRVLLSKEEHVTFCSNKIWTAHFFRVSGVLSPQAVHYIQDYKEDYPCLLEVLDEKDNIVDSFKIENRKDLYYIAEKYNRILVRPFIEGTLYEIDVFCDYSGNPIYITPKVSENARGQETSRFRVVNDEQIETEVKRIIQTFRPVGPLTIKMTKQKKTGRNYYIRVEPRFGDNATIAIKAGADAPAALYQMMLGMTIGYRPNAADHNTVFGQFEKSVCLNQAEQPIHEITSFTDLYEMNSSIDTVIFDLDDTLYSERDYLRSGYHEAARKTKLRKIPQVFNKLCVALEKGKSPFETVLKEVGAYSEEMMELCEETVRFHKPNIELYDGVQELFFELHKQKRSVGIITDGDPLVQRAKVESLGLESMVDEIIYTDELAGDNGDVTEFRAPNDIPLLIMKKRFQTTCRNMAFVGDDKKLEFVAPQDLGVECYWKENKDGMYE
ncbi:MAG: sugar transferase [Anaerostipes sp.]|nr:sugar transferase [Anaerostipes sp.]